MSEITPVDGKLPKQPQLPQLHQLPLARWLSDLLRLLPIRSQFVISGGIHDNFLASLPGGAGLVPRPRALWATLSGLGYTCLLIYDPGEGIRVYPDENGPRALAEQLFDLKLNGGSQVMGLESLALLMRKLVSMRETRCALLIDFASRIARQPDHLSEAEHRFFVQAEKLSLSAAAQVPKEGGVPLFNPVLWLVNRPQDLPSWLTLDSERVASLVAGRPDYEMREAAIRLLAPLFAAYAEATAVVQAQFIKAFCDGTEGMSLAALSDITELSARQGLGIADIDDALRCYKVGALDNPWRKDHVRKKVHEGEARIEDRVKGQRPAVVKTLDILKRSAMGLVGAHTRNAGNRPRGVLFFAGPTGVGKTELAKTLTQLVFGDESAYIRFDMSEFAEEHNSARLLGAPPGYIGYDAGGELTNAVREKPFSVVLFDEIEKAHPRILDKFLQILEDGRLTDGRGDVAYFTETILVFTSNLGIFVEDENGQRQQNVRPGDPYALVEARVREAIGNYFKYRLSRPELLNRIGDNIVVFNFITPEVAGQIFDGMLKNIARRLHDEYRLRLAMTPEIRAELLARCTADLSHGGRGIGNQLESVFVNPLARALFAQELAGHTQLLVERLREEDRVISLDLRLT